MTEHDQSIRQIVCYAARYGANQTQPQTQLVPAITANGRKHGINVSQAQIDKNYSVTAADVEMNEGDHGFFSLSGIALRMRNTCVERKWRRIHRLLHAVERAAGQAVMIAWSTLMY